MKRALSIHPTLSWSFALAATAFLVACGGSPGGQAAPSSAVVGAEVGSQESVVALDKKNKVLICHKGRDKRVPESAVAGHMRHGDTLGSCTPAVTCPCFDEADILAEVALCDPVLPAAICAGESLVLTCVPSQGEPGFPAFYFSQNGGSCQRNDAAGMEQADDVTAEQHAACVAAIESADQTAGFCP